MAEASSSAGLGGGVPAGRTNRLGRMVERTIACCRVALPVRTLLSPLRGPCQRLVNAGTAQIGVDEQDARAFLRQHDGGVDAGGGLAFLRQRAGDMNDFRRRAEARSAAGKCAGRDKIRPSATGGGIG